MEIKTNKHWPKVILFSLFMAILSYVETFSATEEFNFRQLSPLGGFSYRAIQKICQDTNGKIWLQGRYGIISYDSKNISWFLNHPECFQNNLSGYVYDMETDHLGLVWALTNQGVYYLDVSSQNFIPYSFEMSQNLITIQKDSEQKVWILSSEGIYKIESPEEKPLVYPLSIENESPYCLHLNYKNEIFIGTTQGSLFKIDIENASSYRIKNIELPIKCVLYERNGIWIATEYTAYLLNELGEIIEQFEFKDGESSLGIRHIYKDSYGRIWFATFGGLFMKLRDNITQITTENCPDLPHNSVYYIFEDQENGVWIATWSGGLTYLHKNNNKFRNYQKTTFLSSIEDNNVSTFAQTKNGEMYIGTEKGGLHHFKKEKNLFKEVKIVDNFKHVNIKCLLSDQNNNLWVGTLKHGLYCKKNNDSFFKTIYFDEREKKGGENDIISLCETENEVWAASYNGKIWRYDLKNEKLRLYKKNIFENLNYRFPGVTCMFHDGYFLWIGCTFGLLRINLDNQRMEDIGYNISEGNNTIYFMNKLHDNELWIGHSSGIIGYNFSTKQFSPVRLQYDLSEKICGFIKDNVGCIWITTEKGLLRYDPKLNTQRRFDINDGIQGNIFIPQSVFRDTDGEIYLGGTNGFTLIDGKNIKLNGRAPKTIINKIVINNKKIIYPGKNKTEIKLNAKETSLRFFFVADNYLLPSKNKFQYRLTGFDNEWIFSSNEGSATFTNLPSGSYVFEVKSCNNDGIWNNQPTRIYFTIAAPWYRTPFSIAFSIAFILLVIFLIVREIKSKADLRRVVYAEKLKNKYNDEFLQQKINFFLNISHEFRTPLTLIAGPVYKLIDEYNYNDKNQIQLLDIIKRNSDRMLLLVNQILDFRKLSPKSLSLDIEPTNIYHLIDETVSLFQEKVKEKNIRFRFSCSDDLMLTNIDVDKEKIEKIVFNLLSNAFKFTPDFGHIEVIISTKEDESPDNDYLCVHTIGSIATNKFVNISVIDSGVGIETEELKKIFDRFEQSNIEMGYGIGLDIVREYTLLHQGEIMAKSTQGKGSLFSIKIPMQQTLKQLLNDNKNIRSYTPLEKRAVVSPLSTDKPRRILIVEDNEDLVAFLAHLFSKKYTIQKTHNGKEALEELNSKNYDLVISDIMMPEINGYELCKTMKSRIETSHIPIVLLSGLASTDNYIMGYETGADAYISKPFDPDLLLSVVDNLLTQRENLKKQFEQSLPKDENVEINGSLNNFFINRLNDIIVNNIENENLSIEFLSKEIAISRSHLFRKIKDMTGYSISEYVRIIRLKKATELLSKGENSIDEIAYRVGFSSHSYFSKCFKMTYKMTPKEYIKKNKKSYGG